MQTVAQDYHRAEPRGRAQSQAGNISAATISVMCALVLTVLLIRGSAAMHLYMAVPVLALNFVGFVVWVQYYRR